MWTFSFFKVVQILLPHTHRKTRMIAWMKVFFTYLEMINRNMAIFREKSIIEAYMTPQIIYIERYLNSRYGRYPWDILIVEGYELGPYVWYLELPAGEVDFFMDQADSFVWTSYDSITVDFVVQVPTALQDECPYIAAIVQKYKLAGKTFIIQLM